MPYLEFLQGRLHYQKYGKGPELLLALHGFGQQAVVFQAFEEGLGSTYTIYAIDLPFHGLTQWSDDTFYPANICEWIDKLLAKEGQKRCSLLGHSLGGRIWLSCLPTLQSKVDHVFLLAPDGVATKAMSLPDLIPIWCRKEMVKTVQKPAWLLKLASWLYQTHLLSSFAYRYLKYHFRTSERQQRLLQTWISLSHFKINLKQISKSLNSQCKIMTILGKDDPLIDAVSFKVKAQTIPQMEIIILPGQHQLTNKKTAEILSERLKK